MLRNMSSNIKPSDGTKKVKRDLVVNGDVMEGDVAKPRIVRWIRCGRKTAVGRL